MMTINKIKFLGIMLLAVALAVPGFALAVNDFEDIETSSSNIFSAADLDMETSSTQTGMESGVTASGMVPGTSVSRDGKIENSGSGDLQYRVEFEKEDGSDSFCDVLQLQAEKNGAVVYNDDLLDFTVNGGILNSGNDDDWDFTVSMPIGAPHSVEGLDCDFNLKFIAWQTSFAGPTQGWVDEEEIYGNEITAGDWEPVISGLTNTELLDTKGLSNSDMAKVSISWSTDEDTTSNVVYDTASQADCASYAQNSLPVDATTDQTNHEVTLSNLLAGTTYYYRALSEDSGGHEVCSSEESFTIAPSTADAPTNDIVLNEFVPNPSGTDGDAMPDGEWVELYNKGGSDTGVNGWVVYDSTDSNGVTISSSNTNTGDTTVPAGGFLVVYIEKAYFNNTGGDTVKLYSDLISNGGTLIDSHSYAGSIPEGKSFARFPDGIGVWIDPDVTPGEKNELKDEELEIFRNEAVAKCFDEEGERKESKEDICQGMFLEYIGMLVEKNSQKMSDEMMKKFGLITEKETELVEQPAVSSEETEEKPLEVVEEGNVEGENKEEAVENIENNEEEENKDEEKTEEEMNGDEENGAEPEEENQIPEEEITNEENEIDADAKEEENEEEENEADEEALKEEEKSEEDNSINNNNEEQV